MELRKYLTLYFSIAAFLMHSSISAQFNFEVAANLLDRGTQNRIALAASDINGDWKDDYVSLDEGLYLSVFYQGLRGHPFTEQVIDTIDGEAQWSVATADLDRNGYKDIVVAGALDGIKIYYQEDGAWSKFTIEADDVFAQAMNIHDINQDGWSDVFVCNDIGHNLLLWNINGQLKKDTLGLFQELHVDSSAGNYGSVWSDFDQDGDPDLYIAKCSAFAGRGDSRRINQLYINDNGSFISSAKTLDLDIDDQSWTADFQDYDNDGDFDLWLTNHVTPSMLLENINGNYADVTDIRNISYLASVSQSLMTDFNLDGNLDVVSVGGPQFMHTGTSGKTFNLVNSPFDHYIIKSAAFGDFDNNGYYDMITCYGRGVNDRIWINQDQANNGIWCYLKGTLSNPDAIGTIVKLYGPWGVQTREVREGESYGISNSSSLFFGIKDQTKADSLVIHWPIGEKMIIKDIPANHYVVALEDFGSDMSIEPHQFYSEACSGDTIVLTAPRANSYKWNTGSTDQVIKVTKSGFYQASIARTDSKMITLPGTEIRFDPRNTPAIDFEFGDKFNCDGDFVSISTTETIDLIWSDGSRDNPREVNSSANLFFSIKGTCGRDTSEILDIQFDNVPDAPRTESDTVAKGATATLNSLDGAVKWYETERSKERKPERLSLDLPNLQRDTSLWAASNFGYLYSPTYIGKPINQDSIFLLPDTRNNSVHFELSEPILLSSIKVHSFKNGVREFVIMNPRREVLWKKKVNIDSGVVEVPINEFLIDQNGFFRLFTSDSVNIASFGTKSPYFGSTEDNLDYPYIIDDVMQIVYTSFSTTRYDYFFDWKISQWSYCEGSRTQTFAIVDSTVSQDNLLSEFNIRPNPVDDKILISRTSTNPITIAIIDINGKRVEGSAQLMTNVDMDIKTMSLLPGVYFLRIGTSSKVRYWRFVKL